MECVRAHAHLLDAAIRRAWHPDCHGLGAALFRHSQWLSRDMAMDYAIWETPHTARVYIKGKRV